MVAEIQDLPRWVWDLLADLIVEDDTHPTLYFTSGGFQGHRQYDWCPNVVLEKIPKDVRVAAQVIARYRMPATGPEPASEDPEERTGDKITDPLGIAWRDAAEVWDKFIDGLQARRSEEQR